MNIEKIAENDRKIEQLTKNIKRDTEKRKKLMWTIVNKVDK